MAEKLLLVGRKQGTERAEREKCFFEEAERETRRQAGKRGHTFVKDDMLFLCPAFGSYK